MKKAIILLTIIVATLTSCEKSCYQFNVTSKTTTYNNYNDKTTTSIIKQCDLTARKARKVAEGMTNTVRTGVGKQLVTVETTVMYHIQY
jgi:hypothetical protein